MRLLSVNEKKQNDTDTKRRKNTMHPVNGIAHSMNVLKIGVDPSKAKNSVNDRSPHVVLMIGVGRAKSAALMMARNPKTTVDILLGAPRAVLPRNGRGIPEDLQPNPGRRGVARHGRTTAHQGIENGPAQSHGPAVPRPQAVQDTGENRHSEV